MYPEVLPEDFKARSFECSHEEYHLIKDAVHSSTLFNIVKSPHSYDFFLRNPKESTAQMKFGTIAHGVMLEGSLYLSRFVVEPVFRGLTGDGRETTSLNAKSVKTARDEWYAQLPKNALVMSKTERDKLMFMLDSLLNHKFVQEVLKDGVPEFKKVWRDSSTGFKCVSSDDFVSFKNDVWIDIKTTQSSYWVDFRRSVEKYGYPFQCAFYQRGIKALRGQEMKEKVWIAIESTPPYECRVFPVDPYYLAAGEYQVSKAMRDLKTCIENNFWPQGQVIFDDSEPSPLFKYTFDPILTEGLL